MGAQEYCPSLVGRPSIIFMLQIYTRPACRYYSSVNLVSISSMRASLMQLSGMHVGDYIANTSIISLILPSFPPQE